MVLALFHKLEPLGMKVSAQPLPAFRLNLAPCLNNELLEALKVRDVVEFEVVSKFDSIIENCGMHPLVPSSLGK